MIALTAGRVVLANAVCTCAGANSHLPRGKHTAPRLTDELQRSLARRPREGGDPVFFLLWIHVVDWIPAYAGKTTSEQLTAERNALAAGVGAAAPAGRR